MRAPSSHAAVIALGLGAFAVAALKLLGGADWTPLALFAAALIVTELLEDADRIRSREPTNFEPFRVASALHIAVAIVYLTFRTTLVQVVAAREAFQPDVTTGAGEAALGAAVALFATGHPWNLVALVPLALVVHLAYIRLARVRRETLQALETFANIVDERDPSTYQHSLRVARPVDRLARSLALPFSDIDRPPS